jgi:GntR family transcriptional regulator
MEIRIVPGSTVPIYKQVVDQVRLGVRSGGRVPGDPLPSVRALAERLVINPNTVAHAYAELVRDGIIEARQGRGYFVASRRQVYSEEERERRLREALDSFIGEALSLGYDRQEIRRAVARRLDELDSDGAKGRKGE